MAAGWNCHRPLRRIVRYSKEVRLTGVMKKLFLGLFAAMLTLPLAAQTTTLLNLDKSGLAIQGYDPVAFFTDGKPVKGKPEFPTRHNGALYYFASKEHRDLFKADPAKYEPAFGGYCAYGVSRNKLVEIDVDAFQIVDGKLLLQYSKGVRDDFNKDIKGNLAKANGNWPVLVEKKGK
jgi:YHS domain-containing protein